MTSESPGNTGDKKVLYLAQYSNLNWSNTDDFVAISGSEVSMRLAKEFSLNSIRIRNLLEPLRSSEVVFKVSETLKSVYAKWNYQMWNVPRLVIIRAWIEFLNKDNDIREGWETPFLTEISLLIDAARDRERSNRKNPAPEVRDYQNVASSFKKQKAEAVAMEQEEGECPPVVARSWGDICEMTSEHSREALESVFSALETKIAEAPISNDVEIPKNLREAMPIFHETLQYLAKAGDFELKASDSLAIEVDHMIHADCFDMDPKKVSAAVERLSTGTAMSKAVRSLLAMFDEMTKPSPHDLNQKDHDASRCFIRRQVSIEFQSSLYRQPVKKFSTLLRYNEVPEDTVRSRLLQIFPQQSSVVAKLISIIKQAIGLMVRKATSTIKNRSGSEELSSLETIEKTYHKSDRAIVLSVLPPSTKSVLKDGARKKAQSNPKWKPTEKDFEQKATTARPFINPKNLILDIEELAYVKSVNERLHKLEVAISRHHPELYSSSLVETKKNVIGHIELLFGACKRIENELKTRKTIVYNHIRARISAEGGKKKRDITPKDWVESKAECQKLRSFGSIQLLVASTFSGSISYILG